MFDHPWDFLGGKSRHIINGSSPKYILETPTIEIYISIIGVSIQSLSLM